jgi:RecB family exonuclease
MESKRFTPQCDEPLYISFSQIEKFQECELEWMYARQHRMGDGYIEAKARSVMDVGTHTHKVMELYHSYPVEQRNVDTLREALDTALVGVDNEWEVERTKMFAGQFWKKFKDDPERASGTEVLYETEQVLTVRLPLDEVYLTGTVDDILVSNGRGDIGEYKTHGSRPDFKTKVTFNKQACIYPYLVEHGLPDLVTQVDVVTFTLFFPGGLPKRITRKVGWRDKEWGREHLFTIAGRMADIWYGRAQPIPRVGWPCNKCEFRSVCEPEILLDIHVAD